MKISIINKPKNTEKLVATAARLCYSKKTGRELFEKFEPREMEKLNDKLLSLGHYSPFEHAHFTFSIEGISRVCSHQLVRHRIANYSQKSQRYNREAGTKIVVPPSVKAKDLESEYIEIFWKTQKLYEHLIENDIPEEDARYILPAGIETNLIMTMNIRSLFNFFSLRLCKQSQWEIRELAKNIWVKCKEESPGIFTHATPCNTCKTRECQDG